MVDFSFIVSLYVSDLPNVTISTVQSGEVQYSRLCFEMAWWTTPRYSVTFAVAILRIEYCNVRTSARFHEVVSVCVTASRYTLRYRTVPSPGWSAS